MDGRFFGGGGGILVRRIFVGNSGEVKGSCVWRGGEKR